MLETRRIGKIKTMIRLTESKLQKAILLIGAVLVLINLSGVNFYQTYTAILQSIGIAVITFALLILLKDYKPQIHRKIWRIIKRYWLIFALVLLVPVGFYVNRVYSNYLVYQQFHKSEIAYQHCLDKIVAQDKEIRQEATDYRATNRLPVHISFSDWLNPTTAPLEVQKYIEAVNQIHGKSYIQQWSRDGRPGYSDAVGFWEISLVNWVLHNSPDFCAEFNPIGIQYFLSQKLMSINGAERIPSNPFSL